MKKILIAFAAAIAVLASCSSSGASEQQPTQPPSNLEELGFRINGHIDSCERIAQRNFDFIQIDRDDKEGKRIYLCAILNERIAVEYAPDTRTIRKISHKIHVNDDSAYQEALDSYAERYPDMHVKHTDSTTDEYLNFAMTTFVDDANGDVLEISYSSGFGFQDIDVDMYQK